MMPSAPRVRPRVLSSPKSGQCRPLRLQETNKAPRHPRVTGSTRGAEPNPTSPIGSSWCVRLWMGVPLKLQPLCKDADQEDAGGNRVTADLARSERASGQNNRFSNNESVIAVPADHR
ncbi:hypothetical protein MRX96_054474 [Rhipicephalus microplus]